MELLALLADDEPHDVLDDKFTQVKSSRGKSSQSESVLVDEGVRRAARRGSAAPCEEDQKNVP